ncbi:MAG: NACHT domain-containing protein, partial [Candidatus Zixiibacteriota bacterium]
MAITEAFLLGKAFDIALSKTLGIGISAIFKNIALKRDFKKAIVDSINVMVENGYPEDQAGNLYKEYFLREGVKRELWAKILEPSSDGEIDYDLLARELDDCWEKQVNLDAELKESLGFFLDELQWLVWSKDSLRDLLKVRIYQDLGGVVRPAHADRFKARCLEYIRDLKQQEFNRLLREGIWVEPALSKIERESDKSDERRKGREFDRGEGKRIPPQELLRRDSQSYIIVADSGMGKTTLLHWLQISLAKGEFSNDYLPVYFHLSRLENCKNSRELISIISDQFQYGASRLRMESFIEYFHKRGRILFLLDGLDQIQEQGLILQCLGSHDIFGSNKTIVTTRPITFNRFGSRLRHEIPVQIEPFNQKRIKDYLRHLWDDTEIRALVRENPDLVKIPILLQMIYVLTDPADKHQKKFDNKYQLYHEFV